MKTGLCWRESVSTPIGGQVLGQSWIDSMASVETNAGLNLTILGS